MRITVRSLPNVLHELRPPALLHLTIPFQSTKLRTFAMVQMLQSYNSIYFWVFCGALFVNCLYPFVLFNTSSTWWRRDAVAFVDIGLVCFLPNPSPSSCRTLFLEICCLPRVVLTISFTALYFRISSTPWRFFLQWDQSMHRTSSPTKSRSVRNLSPILVCSSQFSM